MLTTGDGAPVTRAPTVRADCLVNRDRRPQKALPAGIRIAGSRLATGSLAGPRATGSRQRDGGLGNRQAQGGRPVIGG